MVYRYALNSKRPDDPNTYGARWNSQGTAVIYASLTKATVMAEFANLLDSYSPRPSRINYTLYTVEVAIPRVVDLSAPGRLARAGITSELASLPDFSPCQLIGAAALFSGAGGLLVPSARGDGGGNLVIFYEVPGLEFAVVAEEPLVA
jgi:RES domain-containing protein